MTKKKERFKDNEADYFYTYLDCIIEKLKVKKDYNTTQKKLLDSIEVK